MSSIALADPLVHLMWTRGEIELSDVVFEHELDFDERCALTEFGEDENLAGESRDLSALTSFLTRKASRR
jgi:hypothetical protein